MDIKAFIDPTLSGQRFEDNSVPVEFLEDFALYEALLKRIAKQVFYEKFHRSRVPTGFDDAVSLKLQQVEPGSAILKMMLVANSFLIGDIDTFPIYEEARDRIVKAIDAVQNDRNPGNLMPALCYGYFNKIGKRLRDGESIDFAPNSAFNGRLTKENRKKLARLSPEVQNVRAEVTLRGKISELDKLQMKCTVLTTAGMLVPVAVDKKHKALFTEAFQGYEESTNVKLTGIGLFNRNDRLETFDDVDSITILNEFDVPTKLEELSNLKAGWYEGGGATFSLSNLKWLSDLFDNEYDIRLLLPFTFPTPGGDIEFEWKVAEHDLTLNVNLTSKIAQFHYLNTKSLQVEEQELNFNDPEQWPKFVKGLFTYFKIESVGPQDSTTKAG